MTREQFITQVEGVQEALRRFLTALCCGDSSLADDIAQEACVKAYLTCDSLKDQLRFRSWIFRIGYNAFIDNKRRSCEYATIDEAAFVAGDAAGDDAFRYQELYAALEKLPSKERTSVLLFYMEGYSVKEIAIIVDASVDAVRQHLSRGRNHLRGLLST